MNWALRYLNLFATKDLRIMRILHLIDSGGLYGAEYMLLHLMEAQMRLGLEPVLASIGELHVDEKPVEIEARRRGLRVEPFRMRPGPNIPGALGLLRLAWREKCDLLHSHGYKANILFGFMPRQLRRLPMVTTLHGWTWTGGADRMGLYERLDRASLRFIDSVVVVNETMRNKIKLPCVHVVHNGISTVEGEKGQQFPLDPRIVDFCDKGYVLGAIGRLSPEKGFDILLDAIHEVTETNPEVRLVILGEGRQRGALEARVRKLGLKDRVLMPGYVGEARRYLSLFKIFVLSSLTEGLPMVILEAMQAGIPIVSTSVGGIPGVLENGKAGVLVPEPLSSDLREGIIRIINNEELAKKMTDTARKLIDFKYSAKAMAMNYSTIYNGLLCYKKVKTQMQRQQN